MSGQNVQQPVYEEIQGLLRLADQLRTGDPRKRPFLASDFHHQVGGPAPTLLAGTQDLWDTSIPAHSAILLTAINLKVVTDFTDVQLAGNDWRSMTDIHPFSATSNATLQLLVGGVPKFPPATDLLVINRCVLFVMLGQQWTLRVVSTTPAPKTVVGTLALNYYVVPDYIGHTLAQAETTIVTTVYTPSAILP